MAKKWKKAAAKMTTDDVLNRVFGKGAAKKLRALVALEDEQKCQKKRKKRDDD